MVINSISGINVGNKTVIDSGSIVTSEKSVRIKFTGDFEFEFRFKDDIDDKSARAKIVGEQNSKIAILEIINFNNPLGQMTTTPMPFASNAKTNLTMSVNFAVYILGTGTVLHYTFFEEGR